MSFIYNKRNDTTKKNNGFLLQNMEVGENEKNITYYNRWNDCFNK